MGGILLFRTTITNTEEQMAKKVTAEIRLQIPAGAANPAPPVGPALGQAGVNIMEFFNAATQSQAGTVIPVVITVYQDRSFTFITKSPPAAVLIKKLAGLASGSKAPGREKAGKITRSQIKQIVQTKKNDINARSEAAAMKIIEGTARSMGIEVVDG